MNPLFISILVPLIGGWIIGFLPIEITSYLMLQQIFLKLKRFVALGAEDGRSCFLRPGRVYSFLQVPWLVKGKTVRLLRSVWNCGYGDLSLPFDPSSASRSGILLFGCRAGPVAAGCIHFYGGIAGSEKGMDEASAAMYRLLAGKGDAARMDAVILNSEEAGVDSGSL
jgi:hypothetical protein